jgi:hypothetical protein
MWQCALVEKSNETSVYEAEKILGVYSLIVKHKS